MKNILLSTVALVGLTAGAMAADLPLRAAPPAPIPVAAVPVFTWTGFHIGVNGGVAFQDDNDNSRRRAGRAANRGNRGNGGNEDSSILGGVQAGYNMQFGMFVAGFEADIQAIDFERINPRLANGRNNNGGNGGNNMNGRNNEDEVDGFGTVRGKLGVAFGRTMVYGTGGLAWKTDEGNNGPRGNSSDNIGYTVGGGVEYAFTNNISVKVEGLYVDFSEDNNNNNRNRRNRVNFTGNDSREFGLVRAGLNYRFNTF